MFWNQHKAAQVIPSEKLIPLCIDMDGTLIQGDVIDAALSLYCKPQWWRWLQVGLWMLKGRAYFKMRLHGAQKIDVKTLRYNQPLLNRIREEKRKGRKIVLVTAADQSIAREVADHVGLFDEVIASDGVHNYRAQAKAKILCEHFGKQGFIYAGNARDDLKVWIDSAEAWVVNASPKVKLIAKSLGIPTEIF